MSQTARYLSPKTILFLSETERDPALRTLIDQLAKAKKIKNPDEFYEAILAREQIVSTGIGMGVAIPHAKLPGYKDFFIAIGIQKESGINWNSLDGAPVRLIFLIGGPDDRQSDYLQILSRLTAAIKNPEQRKKLLAAKTPEEIIALFKE